jgi:hypothetical protein
MKPLVHVDKSAPMDVKGKKGVGVLPSLPLVNNDVRLQTRQKTCPKWTQV